MKPVFRANLYFLIILTISIFAPYIISPIMANLGFGIPLTLIANHILIFIVPALIYIYIIKGNIKHILMLNKPKGRDIIRAILIAILSQPIMFFFSYLSSLFFTNDVALFMESTRNYPTWLMFIVVAITPAITEEVTIRGVILSGYEYKTKHVAAIMTGFMFGIMHLNLQQFLYAFAIGIIFAYMVRATGSLVVAMITHLTINGTQLLMQRMATSNLSAEDFKNQMDIINNLSFAEKVIPLIVYFIIALIFAIIIKGIIKKMEKENFNVHVDDLDVNTKIDYKHENYINFPFIISIIVFILYFVVDIVI